MAEQKSVAYIVDKAIRGPVEEIGYDIWDIEYLKEGSEWYLRITIDSEKGIDIDDCEKAYRVIDPIITELDPIADAYHLEVSSPGIERELRTVEHYRASVGKKVRIRFFVPVNGARELVGELAGISEDGTGVLLKSGGDTLTLEKKKIAKTNIYFDFEQADSGE